MLAKYIKILFVILFQMFNPKRGGDERLTSRRRQQRLPSGRQSEPEWLPSGRSSEPERLPSGRSTESERLPSGRTSELERTSETVVMPTAVDCHSKFLSTSCSRKFNVTFLDEEFSSHCSSPQKMLKDVCWCWRSTLKFVLHISDVQSEARGDDERLTNRRRKHWLPGERADEQGNRSDYWANDQANRSDCQAHDQANRRDCWAEEQASVTKKRSDLHFVVTIYQHFSMKRK